MIAFKNNRPALLVGAGFITEYGSNWLSEAFEEAAVQAETTLPFKEDLIASILLYLEESCPLDALPIDELYGKIRDMLREVGLDHLADHLPTNPPPYPVSLGDIARRHPLPLFFINQLEQELSDLQDLGLTKYRFTDLKQCVLALQGHKRWTKTSEKLLSYIEFLLSRYRKKAS